MKLTATKQLEILNREMKKAPVKRGAFTVKVNLYSSTSLGGTPVPGWTIPTGNQPIKLPVFLFHKNDFPGYALGKKISNDVSRFKHIFAVPPITPDTIDYLRYTDFAIVGLKNYLEYWVAEIPLPPPGTLAEKKYMYIDEIPNLKNGDIIFYYRFYYEVGGLNYDNVFIVISGADFPYVNVLNSTFDVQEILYITDNLEQYNNPLLYNVSNEIGSIKYFPVNPLAFKHPVNAQDNFIKIKQPIKLTANSGIVTQMLPETTELHFEFYYNKNY